MLKNIFTSGVTAALVAVVVSVLALASLGKATSQSNGAPVNALGSSIETIRQTFGGGIDVLTGPRDGGLIFKGQLSTTTTATTEVIPAGNIVGFNTISLVSNLPNLSIQLPASTTFPQSFLPRAGDRTSIMFLNATTTTGNTSLVGFVGGSGTILSVASSTPATTASTTGGLSALIHVMRKPNGDLLFMLVPFK